MPGEEEVDAALEEKLPFPTARVVRIIKENLKKEHQIRSEVKVAANILVGEVLKDIARQMDEEEYFTLSFYDPAKYRGVLATTFGHKSGRDIDKVKESGFTPILTNPGIAYAEARMIIVCKKSFTTNTDPEGKSHKLFFGEILSVWVRK